MYNDFSKTKKSNTYNTSTLRDEIDGYSGTTDESGIMQQFVGHVGVVEASKLLLEKLEGELKTNQVLIDKLNSDKDNLLSSKKQIDSDILTLNPSKLDKEIDEIKNNGITIKNKIGVINTQIDSLKGISFDEDHHHELVGSQTKLTSESAVKSAEIKRLRKVVEDLISGGTCQACNRALDNVDNSAHISEHNKTINTIFGEWETIDVELTNIKTELDGMVETKTKVDSRDKLEIERDRLEIEIDNLRATIKSKNSDLKKYNDNLKAIEFNKDIDTKVDLIKSKLAVCNYTNTETIQDIEKVKVKITTNEKDIETKEKIIGQITKEEEVDRLYRIYIDMVGKKGISKLVLRSVLPIINAEVQRLLDDVTDFEVEIFINDKNDVQFMIIKDEVEKHLKSGSGLETTAASIALRCVLGKMSCLPKPNFITFDEVLGKVAQTNIPLMKPLFDKITDMYDTVFFITHNEQVKDWADNIITIRKENNISNICVK